MIQYELYFVCVFGSYDGGLCERGGGILYTIVFSLLFFFLSLCVIAASMTTPSLFNPDLILVIEYEKKDVFMDTVVALQDHGANWSVSIFRDIIKAKDVDVDRHVSAADSIEKRDKFLDPGNWAEIGTDAKINIVNIRRLNKKELDFFDAHEKKEAEAEKKFKEEKKKKKMMKKEDDESVELIEFLKAISKGKNPNDNIDSKALDGINESLKHPPPHVDPTVAKILAEGFAGIRTYGELTKFCMWLHTDEYLDGGSYTSGGGGGGKTSKPKRAQPKKPYEKPSVGGDGGGGGGSSGVCDDGDEDETEEDKNVKIKIHKEASGRLEEAKKKKPNGPPIDLSDPSHLSQERKDGLLQRVKDTIILAMAATEGVPTKTLSCTINVEDCNSDEREFVQEMYMAIVASYEKEFGGVESAGIEEVAVEDDDDDDDDAEE